MAFTLATRQGALPFNMFADAFETYGHHLAENASLAMLGTILKGDDGTRINVKEVYPLDLYTANQVTRITWLLHPAHPATPAFLRQLRATCDKFPGDTRTLIGFLFEDRVAPIAEISGAIGWKISGPVFQQLRAHASVAGLQIETRSLEIKVTRRPAKR